MFHVKQKRASSCVPSGYSMTLVRITEQMSGSDTKKLVTCSPGSTGVDLLGEENFASANGSSYVGTNRR